MGVDIRSKAMLVHVRVNCWSARKFDHSATQTIRTQHQVAEDGGRYNKLLVPKADIGRVESAARNVRKTRDRYTLPWGDGGGGDRLLLAANYETFKSEVNKAIRAYNDAAEEFALAYPRMISDAKSRLGSLFNRGDYPHLVEIRERFSAKIVIMPLPSEFDPRLDLSDEEVRRMEVELEAEQRELFQQATLDIINRAKNALVRMSETLSDPERKFQKTMVTNLEPIAEVLAGLPYAEDHDKEIEALRSAVSALSKTDPKYLREDRYERKVTAKAADDASKIAERMAGLFG